VSTVLVVDDHPSFRANLPDLDGFAVSERLAHIAASSPC
jgi:hypothetical protein